jgi:hypothetical protein
MGNVEASRQSGYYLSALGLCLALALALALALISVNLMTPRENGGAGSKRVSIVSVPSLVVMEAAKRLLDS